MTAVPVLATHVRKARRESQCPICGGWVKVGAMIARCPGGIWMHCSCFVGHLHERDQPGEVCTAISAPADRTERSR
jgi:hypothetical protein